MSENEYKGILYKEVNKLSSINPRFHRISSMLLDHVFMTIVIVPIGILIFAIGFQFPEYLNKWFGFGLMFFPFFIYLNKDVLKGKSPAKRILGYQVIDRKTGRSANELQCFIRNLTICIIWPIEVVVGFINPERRIGDYLANTKVIKAEKEKLQTIWSDFKNTRLKPSYLVIILIGIVYFYGFSQIMPMPILE